MDTTLQNTFGLTQDQAKKSAELFRVANSTPPVITPESLTGNAKLLKIPTVTPTTTAVGLLGTIESGNKQFQTSIQQEQQLAQENARVLRDSSREDYEDTFKSIFDTQNSRGKLEEAANIPQLSRELTDITNQIEARQVAIQREIEAAEKASGGTVGGASAEVNRIRREGARELADLAIVQNARNRNLVTAQSLVDRKIELQLEPLKAKLEFQKQFYEENKADFTKAEDRAFQLKIKESDRAYEEQKVKTKLLEDTKLKLLFSASSQGASNQVLQEIQNADTTERAVAAAGLFAGDILDREYKKAQLDNLYSQIAERDREGKVIVDTTGKVVLKPQEATKLNKELIGTDAYKAITKGKDSLQFLNQFEKTFNETGATSGVFSPRENAKLKAEYNATILNLKEFFNLGVLNGPDEAILKSIIPDPTNRSAALTTISGGVYLPAAATRAGIDNMKKQIETTIDDRYKSISAQYGDYSTESLNSLKDLQRVYIQQKVALNPNVAQLIEENPNLTYEEIISVITD